MQFQNVSSKRGEVQFRKMLVNQQIEGQTTLDNEFNAAEIEKILLSRMEQTYRHISQLKANGVLLSPYIEIGAERGQRSLVMENDIGVQGVAVDISYDMLKSCVHYSRVFVKDRLPSRACCDANSLPFASGSIPFIFCYETLHHFPDPYPIIKEIHRVLAPGGCFFFNEEPYKRVFHLNLYKGNRMYSKKALGSTKLRKVFDYFFSELSCNETEYGIIENHSISLSKWRHSFRDFNVKEIAIRSMKGLVKSHLFGSRNFLYYFLAYLLGGEISGICRKAGTLNTENRSITDVLICPACKENGEERSIKESSRGFYCNRCSNEYPRLEDIIFLLPKSTFSELYSEVFNQFKQNIESSK